MSEEISLSSERGNKYEKVIREPDEAFLAPFTAEQRQEIRYKQRVLSSIAFFIGKDFTIPVELNEPGKGWHWDFANNIIRIDPVDLLERPLDYLRFVIAHEGAHRRVSRTEFIPQDIWNQPGFSFMMNSIEDPRVNNFTAEAYPKFAQNMEVAYKEDLDFEQKAEDAAKKRLGKTPRFMQAGFEYIRQWFSEASELEIPPKGEVSDEVREVVTKTMAFARDSWLRYPTKEEADESEELIKKYAEKSYRINRDRVWPEFKKLIEEDKKDQSLQELMNDLHKKKAQGENLPPKFSDKLTEDQKKELESAIEKAIEKAKQGKGKDESGGAPKDGESEMIVPLDSLSPELQEKVRQYFSELPPEDQKALEEKAKKALEGLEKEIDKMVEGKLVKNPNERQPISEEIKPPQADDLNRSDDAPKHDRPDEREVREKARKKMEEALESKDDAYHKTLREVAPVIDQLTGDLRSIFIKRKLNKMQSGARQGRRWNIPARIAEKIAGIPLWRSEARMTPERASEEKDYAVTLMIDLSRSMRGSKIKEAFKSAVILAESLAGLGIKFEVVGFQDRLLEFKSFGEHFDDRIRGNMGRLTLEVSGSNPEGHNNPSDNDDGVCLAEASKHLESQRVDNKILIVLSDGLPEARGKSRDRLNRDLKIETQRIEQHTSQKLIGVGLESDAVAKFYTNNIPNVTAEEMAPLLADLLHKLIEG